MTENSLPFRIHKSARIAHAQFKVADLARMLPFYRDLLGLKVREAPNSRAELAPSSLGPPLLTLVEHPTARPVPAYSTGLYHLALRFPHRKSLATTLLRLLSAGWPLQGASDHLVSEAIYLVDPEGNGLELYRDRPRAEWPRRGERIQMATLPLDLNALLEEADKEAAKISQIHPQMDIGHIHLQVSDLASTAAFYQDLVGFEIMAEMPSALFLAAGGYHHHLGANIWQSRNAPRPEPDNTGLHSYAIEIPENTGWLHLFERLSASGATLQALEREDRVGFVLEDQDGNLIEVLTQTHEELHDRLSALERAAH